MGFSLVTRGSTRNIESFLRQVQRLDIATLVEPYAQAGVDALASATPRDTGLTADSWSYVIKAERDTVTITWTNSNRPEGFPVAVALQYGHGTGTGGYIEGQDYINPAIRPIFDQIADGIWKVVTSA